MREFTRSVSLHTGGPRCNIRLEFQRDRNSVFKQREDCAASKVACLVLADFRGSGSRTDDRTDYLRSTNQLELAAIVGVIRPLVRRCSGNQRSERTSLCGCACARTGFHRMAANLVCCHGCAEPGCRLRLVFSQKLGTHQRPGCRLLRPHPSHIGNFSRHLYADRVIAGQCGSRISADSSRSGTNVLRTRKCRGVCGTIDRGPQRLGVVAGVVDSSPRWSPPRRTEPWVSSEINPTPLCPERSRRARA